jgi:excisionase family DNA binding protein
LTTAAPSWVTVAKAAKLAGVSERTVWSLTSAGKWESRRFGSRRLVARQSAEEYREKKVLKLQCSFQSDSGYSAIVDDVLTQLRPQIEETVRRVIEGRR